MNRFHSLAVGVLCAAGVVVHAQAGLTGKWQGSTESGRPVILDIKVKAQQVAGTFTVGQQTADIAEGKAEEKAFSFKATIDTRTMTCSGRLVDDAIELTVQGVRNPLTLKRVK